MYSIRRRLTIVLAAGFALLILVSGFSLSHLLEKRVTEEFDHGLVSRVHGLAALTEQEDGQIEFDYAPEHLQEFERTEDPAYYQFWLDDGLMLLRSARLQALDADLPRDAQTPRDVDLPDGRRGRMVTLAYTPRSSDETEPPDGDDGESMGEMGEQRGIVLAVARGRGRLDSLIGRMHLAIFGVAALAILLAGFFAWRAIKAGLRPIDSIAAQVRTLDADSLGASVSLPRTPEELVPILDQLNSLLGRLGDSFDRERRFTGNVAHELRTPIAELRSLALVGSRWPDDREAVVQFFDDVKDIAGRMEGTIGDLLLLARCEAGVEQVKLGEVALGDTVQETWDRLAAAASIQGLTFEADVDPALRVETDAGKLELILGNLIGNAVSYALPDTVIRCRATQSDERLEFVLTNQAEPLSAEDIRCLAEPFWRKEEARSESEHAGLGLSLVAALSTLLGLNVHFDQSEDGTFRVRIGGWQPRTQRVLQETTS